MFSQSQLTADLTLTCATAGVVELCPESQKERPCVFVFNIRSSTRFVLSGPRPRNPLSHGCNWSLACFWKDYRTKIRRIVPGVAICSQIGESGDLPGLSLPLAPRRLSAWHHQFNLPTFENALIDADDKLHPIRMLLPGASAALWLPSGVDGTGQDTNPTN
jgi:hypothetical protein